MEMKKKKEQSQSIYVTLIVILVALAVAVAVTSVVGKRTANPDISDALGTDDIISGDGENEPALNTEKTEDDTPVFESEKEDGTDTEKDTEGDTEKTVNTEQQEETENTQENSQSDTQANAEAEVEDELPEFSSPVSGYLINGHSESVPVFSVTMNDYRTHTGVDIFAEPGEAVCAAADGVIGAIYEDPMMGTCMTVVHSGGAVSTYKGLYATIPDGIVQGATVTRGQPIAAVGDTALAEVEEESHVHYELAIDGVNVDPCLYMEFNEEVYEN